MLQGRAAPSNFAASAKIGSSARRLRRSRDASLDPFVVVGVGQVGDLEADLVAVGTEKKVAAPGEIFRAGEMITGSEIGRAHV